MRGERTVDRKSRRKKRLKWRALSADRIEQMPASLRWFALGFLVLLVYALLKLVAGLPNVIGRWIGIFLTTVEAMVYALTQAVLSPVGLILMAFIWLVKTGDMYRLLNKVRYLRLARASDVAIRFGAPPRESDGKPSAALTDWQRHVLSQLARTTNPEEQARLVEQLSAYELIAKKQELLPLLQFLHYFRRDDISFFQIAQFLVTEKYIDPRHFSHHELELEVAVLGYISHLQHAGLIEAHITLTPAPDGFYGTVHKVKIPQHVQEVMEQFS